jgi:pyrroline-5-carboxylate reductase
VSDGLFWIVGCGNMAGAMLSRWLETGLDPETIRVVDPARPDLPSPITAVDRIPDDCRPAAYLLLGVKPQGLDDVADDVRRLIGQETTLLSILAGVEMATLRGHFPGAGHIVRVMPNLPVALGKGVVALHADSGPVADVQALMIPFGLVEWFDREEHFALVTALSGSGPAFLYRFIDALGVAASRLGLSTEQAGRMALATIEGASALAAASGQSPAALADRVASKGGSTRSGLDVLDADEALIDLMTRTLDAARQRNVELGEAAKRP